MVRSWNTEPSTGLNGTTPLPPDHVKVCSRDGPLEMERQTLISSGAAILLWHGTGL